MLFGGELEHEIAGKSSEVATYLLVQAGGRHAVEGSQLGIEQHAMTAQNQNRSCNVLDRHVAGSFRLMTIGTAELSAAVAAPLLLFIPDANPGGASSALYSADDFQAPLGPLPT